MMIHHPAGRWLGPLLFAVVLAVGGGTELHAQQGRITGVVIDTLNRRRLAGARIQIQGINRDIITDSSGRFMADSLAPGQYRVSFRHPVLDTLGIRAGTVLVDVAAGVTARANLGVPSGRSFMRLCNGQPGAESRAAIFGVVRNATTDEPLVAASVRASWGDIVADPVLGLRRRTQTKTVPSDSTGRYLICNLAPGLDVTVTATIGGFDVATGEITLRAEEALPLHLSAAANDAQADAVLTGTVFDGERKPLAGADVWVASAKAGESGVAKSDSAGRFRLTGLKPGTSLVGVRRIGSTPARRTVALASGRGTAIQVTLEQQALTLPEITVEAKASRAEQSGFKERKAQGFGKFLDRDDVNRMAASSTGDVLRQLPNVHVDQGAMGAVLTNQGFRGSNSGASCQMALLVDGVVTPPDVIMAIDKSQIDAIEVYDGASRVPMEYQSSATSCGAVMVWLRR